MITAVSGIVLSIAAIYFFFGSLIKTIKGKKTLGRFFSSLITSVLLLLLAAVFVSLSLFIQTLSRYTRETRIGWVSAQGHDGRIGVRFYDQRIDTVYTFTLDGDQWMIEGYFLRWSPLLRWAGGGSYYRITRFAGRWLKADKRIHSIYQIEPEKWLARLFLKYGSKLPFVDAAYGIAAFQYPGPDTFYVYVNDTGFILKKR
jgi:hypothetical protein